MECRSYRLDRVRQNGKEEGGSLKNVTSTHERGNPHSIKVSSQTII